MESQKSLDDRVNSTFMSLGIGTTDIQGMMQHILDCLGALRVRMLDFPIPPKKMIVHNSLRKVFISAVEVMLEEIDKGEEAHDDGSAKKYLLEQFPDESKMRDGRSWLPLHWATCIDVLSDDILSTLLKERPIVTGMSAAPASTAANRTKFSHNIGFEEFEDPDENIHGVENKEDMITDMGLLPIHFLCSLRHCRLANVKRLVDTNSNSVRQIDSRGWLPIHWCAKNSSSHDVLQYLIEVYPRSVFQTTKKGHLPFQIAQMNKDTDIMDIILEHNSDAMDAIDKKGNSSLHDAVKHCNPYGIKKLLKYNPDLGVSKNFKGQVPLHKAFYYINKDSTRLKWRQLESVNLLLESDAQTAAIQDDNGSLPLHLAAYYNTSYECLETLFNVYPSGALVKDGDGRIPVQYSDDPQAQKLLLGTSKHLSAVGMTNSFAQFAANS